MNRWTAHPHLEARPSVENIEQKVARSSWMELSKKTKVLSVLGWGGLGGEGGLVHYLVESLNLESEWRLQCLSNQLKVAANSWMA